MGHIAMKRSQHGQAMVFGLLFIGIAVISLILLFNQGILTRDRVQLENAADAAAYSQAKLFARHQNLIAYTNRAIVANELSLAQVVALVSWSKRYANIPRWVNSFPAYQIPVALIPPKPMVSDILSAVTLPYQLLGIGVRTVSTPVLSVYPSVVSSFNLVMGFFQKAFAVATLEAQARIPGRIVAEHRMGHPQDELNVAPLSSLFLAQNFILTYFADYLPLETLQSGLQKIEQSGALGNTGEGPGAAALLADFLGGATPGSMLVNVAPEMQSKDGKGADDQDRIKLAQEFAANMNEQRNPWLSDRRFDAAVGFGAELPINLGIIKIKLGFKFEVGVFNNGGTAYVYNPLSISKAGKKMPVYGWASIDFSSMGFKLDIDLMIEVCLPVMGCATIFDNGFNLGLGLPLGGATHQLVADLDDGFLTGPQWGTPLQGMVAGAPSPYGEAMHPVHLTTWGWGNVLNVFGLNRGEDVHNGYSGSPSFFGLGSDHAETGRSKEFTVAVSKPLKAVRTSDNKDSLNLQPVVDGADILNRRGRFALHTAGVDDNQLPFMWGAEGNEQMMTISSAETWFAPPNGREESPNQYSPFWDARLREPSQVVQWIAAGDIDLREILGLNDLSAGSIASRVLGLASEFVIKPGRDRLLDKLPTVIKPAVGPVVKDVTDSVLDKVTDGIRDAVGK